MAQVLLVLALSLRCSALRPTASPLVGTRWNLRLNVGLESGTWMPKRFPGWAESGARLLVDCEVEFSDAACAEAEAEVPIRRVPSDGFGAD